MDDREFKDLVAELRKAQREYFRTKSSGALEDARRMERLVDRALLEARQQPRLFG
jgi:hypothetical protein